MTTKPQDPIKNEVSDLVGEVRGLREDLKNTVRKDEAQSQFASRRETNKRRRSSILVVLFTIVMSMQVTSAYVNQCSPGARANAVVDAVISGQLEDIDDVKQAAEDSQPEWFCDTVFPFKATHNDTWPSAQNWTGMAIYAFLAYVGWVWYKTSDEDEDFVSEETPTEG